MEFCEHKYSNIEGPFIYVFLLIHIFILKMESHQNLLDTSGDPGLVLSNSCSNILTYLLFHRADSFLRNYLVFSYSRKYRHFMQPEGSLPHSQVPANCPILSQIDPVHTRISHFLQIHLNIILQSTPGSSKW